MKSKDQTFLEEAYTRIKQPLNEEENKKDYITVNVRLKLANGDSYTTGFNISNHLLDGTTPEAVVKKYFVGLNYTYTDESSSRIVSAELY